MYLRRTKTPAARLLFPAPHLWIPKCDFALVNKSGHLVHQGDHLSAGCPPPPTHPCTKCTIEDELGVTIPSGLTNNYCNNCGSIAGDYVVTWYSSCHWQYYDYSFPCSGQPNSFLRVAFYSEGNTLPEYYRVVLNYYIYPLGRIDAVWRKQITNCSELSGDVSFPFVSLTGAVPCSGTISADAIVHF
jgi:hypothetical protein